MKKTYAKSEVASDDKGYFRFFGGKRWRLGRDEQRAKLASTKLGILFQRAGSFSDPIIAALASAIAKHQTEYVISPNPEMVGAESFVHWVDRYAGKYSDLIPIVPTSPDVYEAGHSEVQRFRTEAQKQIDIAFPQTRPVSKTETKRLHDAIDAYTADIEQRKETTGWIRTKANCARRLKAMPDCSIGDLTRDRMSAQMRYWAERPKVKGKNTPISAKTAKTHMMILRDFWKWLHYSDAFAWKRPEGWDDLKVKIARLDEDRAKINTAAQVDTFTVPELAAIYKHATPTVRLFMLLGLNCGFSTAEIASFTINEVLFDAPHPYAERIGIPAKPGDWIMRVRQKTGVYGEWKLWKETADAIRQAIANKVDKSNLVTTNNAGTRWDAPTKSKNHSMLVANLWHRSIAASIRKGEKVRKLSVKILRKTAGDMVRQLENGEVSAVFLSHGQPVKGDALSEVYSNRPFLKVFKALDEMRVKLQPLFDEDVTDACRWVESQVYPPEKK